MAKKLKMKAVTPRGKKHGNTINPPHVSTDSVTCLSDDGSVELVVAKMSSGAGLWIQPPNNPLLGVAVYMSGKEMAVGIRVGNGALATAISADPDTGESHVQLTTADGEVVVLSGTDIVNAVRNVGKILPGCCKAAKKAKAPRVAAPKKVKKAKKGKKAKKEASINPATDGTGT